MELLGSTSDVVITRVLLDRLGGAGPDVVLVAVDVPDGDGPTATVWAGYPHVRVLAYAEDPAHRFAAQALAAGAGGVLAERTLLDDLRAALRAA
jgi:DNA-binding NarL/FixJ family response regulator